MSPSDLKSMTLSQLRETRSALSKYEYLLEVEKLSPEKRAEAALVSDSVQMAFLKMRNAELAEIRDKLIQNEKELESGTKSVKIALEDLKKVENILSVVGSFVGIVGKIIPLVV